MFGTRIQSPDFKVVAEGYGVPAFRVEKTEEFAHALAAARDVDGPALIPVLLDERDVSPFTDEPSVCRRPRQWSGGENQRRRPAHLSREPERPPAAGLPP